MFSYRNNGKAIVQVNASTLTVICNRIWVKGNASDSIACMEKITTLFLKLFINCYKIYPTNDIT